MTSTNPSTGTKSRTRSAAKPSNKATNGRARKPAVAAQVETPTPDVKSQKALIAGWNADIKASTRIGDDLARNLAQMQKTLDANRAMTASMTAKRDALQAA